MPPPPSGFATLRDLCSFLLGAGILLYVVVFREPPADVVAVGAGITLAGFPVAALFVGGARPNDPPNPPTTPSAQ